MDSNDIIIPNNCILILKYFDVKNQCLSTIQSLMVSETVAYNVVVMEYIENKFIACNNKQRQFYESTSNDMKEMRKINSNLPMIWLYHMTSQHYNTTTQWDALKYRICRKQYQIHIITINVEYWYFN